MSEDYGSIKIDNSDEKTTQKKNAKSRKRSRRKVENLSQPETVESSEANKSVKKTKKGRRSKKRTTTTPLTLFALSLILTVAALGAVVYSTPFMVKKYLPSYIKKNTDFIVNLNKVSFNPLKARFVLSDLEIASQNGDHHEPFLTIPSATFNVIPSALLKKQLVTKNAIIDRAQLTLKRNQDGSTNIGSTVAITSDTFKLSNFPLSLSINNIEFTHSTFSFTDSKTNTSHEGEKISIGIPSISNFSYSNIEYIQPYFSAVINGSLITFAGDKNSSNNNSVICKIDALNLAQYLNYLPTSIPFSFEQGLANGQLEILFNPETKASDILGFKLDIAITDTVVRHAQHDISMTIPEVQLSTTFSPTTTQLKIHTLSLKSPTLATPKGYSIKDLGVLFPATHYDSSKGEQGTNFEIESLSVSNGTISFGSASDKTSRQLKKIGLKITKSDDNKNSISLSGVNKKSRFLWNAELDRNIAKGDFSINNITLADLITSDSLSQSTGRGTLTGSLSITPGKTVGLDYKLSHVDLDFVDVTIGKWFSAKQVFLNNGFITDSTANLGKITIKDGFFNLQTHKLPPLFSLFNKKDSFYALQSLNYQGKGRIQKDDLPQLDIAHLSLVAKDLGNSKPEGDNISLDIAFDNPQKSNITGRGKTKLNNFSLWLSTTFQNLPSQAFLPWFSDNSLFSTTNTVMSGKGVVTLPNQSFKGEIVTGKARFGTKTSKQITWNAISIKGLEYTSKTPSIKIANASISAPGFNWKRKLTDDAPSSQLGYFFNDVFSGGDIKSPNKIPVKINEISIYNGSISIEDNRHDKGFKNHFTNIKGTIKKLDNKGGTSAEFKLAGDISNSPLALEGKANFFGKGNPYEYKLVFNELSGTNFLTKLQKQSSLQVQSDSSSITIFQQKEGNAVNTITEISLANATSKDKTLDLVLAMMHENDTNTQFTVLTQQKYPALDDSFIKEVEMYLNKMVIKAETSPFLLSKENFSDLAQKESVDFRFGEIALTGDGMETLIRLREFLTLHPYVDLKISGEASGEMDYQALAEKLEAKEQSRIDKLNKQLYGEWEAKRQKKLEEEGTTLDDDPFTEEDVFIPKQPKTVSVAPQALIDLANQRAILIGQVFTERLALDPERLQVIETKRLADTMENVVRLKIIAPKRKENLSGVNAIDDPFEDDPFEQN